MRSLGIGKLGFRHLLVIFRFSRNDNDFLFRFWVQIYFKAEKMCKVDNLVINAVVCLL